MLRLKAGVLAVILFSAIAFIGANAEAAHFVNSTGLASPVSTITFDEIILAGGTNVTTQYSAYGVTFTPALWYDAQGPTSFPGISGHYLGNFPPCCSNPFSIIFSTPQESAAFGIATNPTTTTFTALLNGNTVESFATPTDYSTPGLAFVGFTDIAFNEIRVTVGGDQMILIDNIQMSPTAIPTMNEWGMIIFIALAGMGAVYYLRKYRGV